MAAVSGANSIRSLVTSKLNYKYKQQLQRVYTVHCALDVRVVKITKLLFVCLVVFFVFVNCNVTSGKKFIERVPFDCLKVSREVINRI